MTECKRCNRVFQFSWMLRRHLSRKNQCEANCEKSILPPFTENQSFFTENQSSFTGIESFSTNSNTSKDLTCKYCLKVFSRKGNMKVHMRICRLKDDEESDSEDY